MNKTITKKIKPVGIIESVSVAALINVKYKVQTDNNGPVKDEITGRFLKEVDERSEDEKSSLSNLIKAAAGGDIANVSLEEIRFDDVNEKLADLEIAKLEEIENSWGLAGNKLSGILLPGIFLIFGLGLMYMLLNSLNNTEGNGIDGILPQAPGQLTATGDSEPAAQFVENATEALEGINPQTNDQAPEQIPGNPSVAAVNYSKTSPEEAAKIIRAWINQS